MVEKANEDAAKDQRPALGTVELIAAEPGLQNPDPVSDRPVPLEEAVRASARRVVARTVLMERVIADLADAVVPDDLDYR
jgi:hypothetical protein